LELLRTSPIREAYINSLPPRRRFLHGTSVDLYFEESELSIRGEILEDGQGTEESALSFGKTLGIDYWRDEIVNRRGMPIIEAIELTSRGLSLSYLELRQGPREVRLYTANRPGTASRGARCALIGIDIKALMDRSQRVLFVATIDESPGDIEILTESHECEAALRKWSSHAVIEHD